KKKPAQYMIFLIPQVPSSRVFFSSLMPTPSSLISLFHIFRFLPASCQQVWNVFGDIGSEGYQRQLEDVNCLVNIALGHRCGSSKLAPGSAKNASAHHLQM